MSNTVRDPDVLDPALVSLLAKIGDRPPNPDLGDPDEKPAEPDPGLVWLPFCTGEPVKVKLGVPEEICFGLWAGPTMQTSEVLFHVKNLRTGNEVQHGADWKSPVVNPGEQISAQGAWWA